MLPREFSEEDKNCFSLLAQSVYLDHYAMVEAWQEQRNNPVESERILDKALSLILNKYDEDFSRLNIEDERIKIDLLRLLIKTGYVDIIMRIMEENQIDDMWLSAIYDKLDFAIIDMSNKIKVSVPSQDKTKYADMPISEHPNMTAVERAELTASDELLEIRDKVLEMNNIPLFPYRRKRSANQS